MEMIAWKKMEHIYKNIHM